MSDALIGIAAGVATAALVGILIGVAVVCQKKLKQKDIEEEKRQLEEDSGSIQGSVPMDRDSRNVSTQTPISKRTQTPIPVHKAPSSMSGDPYVVGLSPNVHPIIGLPRPHIRGSLPQARQPNDVVSWQVRVYDSQDPHVSEHHSVSDTEQYQDKLQQRVSPEMEQHNKILDQKSTNGHATSPVSRVRSDQSQLKRSASLAAKKHAIIVDLQKNYPTKPIPKLIVTDTMDDERREQYVGNWMEQQTKTKSAVRGPQTYNGMKAGRRETQINVEIQAGQTDKAYDVVTKHKTGVNQKQNVDRGPVRKEGTGIPPRFDVRF